MQAFFIRTDNKYVKISFEEIICIEACGNYMKIITATRSFITLLSLRQLENALPRGAFCRVHRSYIISLNHITAFDQECAFLEGDRKIPIGEQYRDLLQEKVTIIMSDVRVHSRIVKETL